jgi:nicotinamide-nucleotide amidase
MASNVWRGFQLAATVCVSAAFGMAETATPAAFPAKTDYLIIVTGEELLRGAYADGHTLFLTRTFLPMGYHCVGSMLVDDDKTAIQAALRYATNHARLVLVTGGLGPTLNDVTREALAEATGIPLREDPAVVTGLRQRYGDTNALLRANLQRQALIPAQGGCLRNLHGTAVGLVFDTPTSLIVALPGPPRELQPMVREQLIPYLQEKLGTRPPGASLTLRFVGAGQSQLDATMREKVTLPPGVLVGSGFEGSRVDFTFTLPGDRPEDRAALRQLAQDLRQCLGEYYYAEDGTTLEQVVANQLAARGQKLLLVEIGSGGDMAASLHHAGMDDRILAGAWMAASEAQAARQLQGAAAPVGPGKSPLEPLAEAAARYDSNAWTLVVGDLRPQERGGWAYDTWLRVPGRTGETKSFTARQTSETGQPQLATTLLDYLRRRLQREAAEAPVR